MSIGLYSKERWGICKCGHYEWQHTDWMYSKTDQFEVVPLAHCQGRCGVHSYDRDEEGNSIHYLCDCDWYEWIKSVPFGDPDGEAMKIKTKFIVDTKQ